MTDHELLQDYVQNGSQASFSELTARHLQLVYGSALRQLHNRQQAEDATQATFLVLAQKAASLPTQTIIAGWLYMTARFVADNMRKSEQARKRREREVSTMREEQAQPLGDLEREQLGELLDPALGLLKPADRDLVILRYFQNKSHKECADQLNISEEAAKKRTLRALDKMREFFTRKGVAVSSVAMVEMVLAHAGTAVPDYLLAQVTSSVLAMAGVAGAAGAAAAAVPTQVVIAAKGAMKAMVIAKLKAAAATVVIATAVVGGAGAAVVAGTSLVNAHHAAAAAAQIDLSELRAPARALGMAIRTHNGQTINELVDPSAVAKDGPLIDVVRWLAAAHQLEEASVQKFGRSRNPLIMGDAESGQLLDEQLDNALLFVNKAQGHRVGPNGAELALDNAKLGLPNPPVGKTFVEFKRAGERWQIIDTNLVSLGWGIGGRNVTGDPELLRASVPLMTKTAEEIGAGAYPSAEAAYEGLQRKIDAKARELGQ